MNNELDYYTKIHHGSCTVMLWGLDDKHFVSVLTDDPSGDVDAIVHYSQQV